MKLKAKTVLNLGKRLVRPEEEFELDDKELITVLLRHNWAEVVEKEKPKRRKGNETKSEE